MNYLVHYNHNHDRLGRFASSAGSVGRNVGSSILSSRKKKAPPTPDIKTEKKSAKSNNTKLSNKERERLVNHGSAKEIAKHKDKLSNRELEAAVNRLQKEKVQRIDLEKKLSDLNTPDRAKNKKTAMEKVESLTKTIKTVNDFSTEAMKAYNHAATIHNSISADKWPKLDGKYKPPTSSKANYLIKDAPIEEVIRRRKELSPDERKKAAERINANIDLDDAYRKYKDSRMNNIEVNITDDIDNDSESTRKTWDKKRKHKYYTYDSSGKKYRSYE